MAATIDGACAAACSWSAKGDREEEGGHGEARKLPEGVLILIPSAPERGGGSAAEEHTASLREVDNGYI